MATEPERPESGRLLRTFFRLGFLDAPKDAERRQHIRYECTFPVRVRFGSGEQQRTIEATARDVSIGGMLIDGADIPEGAIRVKVEFDLPPDVLKQEAVPRHVETTAAVRYRDNQHKTLSLAFAEPLEPPPQRRITSDRVFILFYAIALAILVPLSFHVEAIAKYVVVWSAGFFATLLLTPLVRSLATKLGMVDVPDERRVHKTPTPRGGGIAVVIGFYCAALLALEFPWESSQGSLTPQWLHSFLFASGILVIVGLIDDIRGMRPLVKLSGQMLAATVMFSSGHGMGRVLGFDLPLAVDFIATVLWFVALTNAFNLIDGLDGLAAGLALVACVGMAGAFFIRRMPSDALIVLGLAGACMAFLRYNFHPASIFLGDTGSMFLGFTFAAIAVATASKGTFLASVGVPLLAVGIPVFDTVLAIWRRSMRALVPAVSPTAKPGGLMAPDAEHLHHRLRRRGLNQYEIAVVLYVINALLVLTGLLSLAFRDQALGIFIVAFVVGSYVVMRHLAEVELWDTGRAIIRGLRRPHQRVAAFVFYPIFDVLCMVVALGLAFGVLQMLQPVERVWEAWIAAIPLWVAPVFLSFCFVRVYSRVWSLARTHDYLVLSVALLASVLLSTGVSSLLHPDHWQRYVVLAFIYTGLSHISLVGSRMFVRGLIDALWMWSESQHYRRGGIVRRVIIYGAGSRCLMYLRERALNGVESGTRRMIVGLVDADTNLRFRRVGGYVVLGSDDDLPDLVQRHRVDEIVITTQLPQDRYAALAKFCADRNLHLSEWHYEERAVDLDEAARTQSGAPADPATATPAAP